MRHCTPVARWSRIPNRAGDRAWAWWELEMLRQIANSYFGLLGQASHSHADRARLANAVRDRGHCVNRALTQTYRKGTA